MAPPAPGRLSTITCCPHFSASLGPMVRAMVSTLPPGVLTTTTRIGLFG
jgi:hypothetical protein